MNPSRLFTLPIVASIFLLAVAQVGRGQSVDPPPAAPAGPFSDGTAIDQGIAYVLLLVALVITYLVH